MKNKRIAVVIDTLSVGGVAKAGIDFIRCLAAENYEVTVYVRELESAQGVLSLRNVKYKPWRNEEKVGFLILRGHFLDALQLMRNRMAYWIHFRNYGKRIIDKARCRAHIQEEYDCVIGYQMVANDVTIMALEKIDAPRKLLWLHGQKKFSNKDMQYYDRLYSTADRIVCVSKDTEWRFQSLMPSCAKKTVTIHNFYNIDEIRGMAQETVEDFQKREDEIFILSIGRISKEKGFDRVPKVAKRLKRDGYRFRWIIVGDGDCRSDVEKSISDLALSDQVLLLGYRNNPYPYLGQCDIYVQPSYSEGYCTSTVEAKILEKPVVTTNVPGMNEQFENGQNGIIVESNVDGIYYGIRKLLDSAELRNRIITNLRDEPISNEEDIALTINVIEGIQ